MQTLDDIRWNEKTNSRRARPALQRLVQAARRDLKRLNGPAEHLRRRGGGLAPARYRRSARYNDQCRQPRTSLEVKHRNPQLRAGNRLTRYRVRRTASHRRQRIFFRIWQSRPASFPPASTRRSSLRGLPRQAPFGRKLVESGQRAGKGRALSRDTRTKPGRRTTFTGRRPMRPSGRRPYRGYRSCR